MTATEGKSPCAATQPGARGDETGFEGKKGTRRRARTARAGAGLGRSGSPFRAAEHEDESRVAAAGESGSGVLAERRGARGSPSPRPLPSPSPQPCSPAALSRPPARSPAPSRRPRPLARTSSRSSTSRSSARTSPSPSLRPRARPSRTRPPRRPRPPRSPTRLRSPRSSRRTMPRPRSPTPPPPRPRSSTRPRRSARTTTSSSARSRSRPRPSTKRASRAGAVRVELEGEGGSGGDIQNEVSVCLCGLESELRGVLHSVFVATRVGPRSARWQCRCRLQEAFASQKKQRLTRTPPPRAPLALAPPPTFPSLITASFSLRRLSLLSQHLPLLRPFSSMSAPYAQEQAIALSAVLKASLLAQKIQQELVGSGGVQKKDKSPVTVGDYTAQALVSALLAAHFPTDAIIGEEDSADLQKPEQATVKAQIVRLAGEAMREALPLQEEEAAWAPVKAVERGDKEWMAAIDRGNSEGGAQGRHWALDPIDGTKGFLRGGQYAVCLGLIQDGEVVLGVMGCPNLPLDPSKPDGEKGALFVAVKGQGAFQRSFASAALTPIKMNALPSLADASFCESVEAGHSDHGTNARIAQLLGITRESVRMDSQAKYCSIARGDGDIYLRLPVSATYEEKVWDHSSGSLLVAEAGGVVSDMHGKPLDFSLGRTLKGNKGVIAAPKEWHKQVIEAVAKAVGEEGK